MSKPHPEGSFRATFEDKLLLSDIVFLRTWYPLSPITYFNPVTSHSLPFKAVWFGAKTVGQLRYEQNLPTPFNPDSVYKPIERVERQFNPLQIPKQGYAKTRGKKILIPFFFFFVVFSSLPFEEKMRVAAPKRNRMSQDESRLVVRSKKEKKRDELLENLEMLKAQKLKKEEEKKKQRFLKFSKEKAKEEERVRKGKTRLFF